MGTHGPSATGPSPSPSPCPNRRQPWSDAGGDEIATTLAAAAAGDSRATGALIERYGPLVWSIAWSYRLGPADTADITQVVWLRLLENLVRIRRPERLGSWIGSVTRHECIRLRRRGEREVATADGFVLDGSSGDDLDEDLIDVERDTTVRQSLETLPARWRILMTALVDAPDASYEELAAAVGMPIGSIGPTRQRCLERLRDSPTLLALAA